MKRRTFVATAGSGLGAAMAGCLGDSDSTGGEPSDDDGDDQTDGGKDDEDDERNDEGGDDVPTDDSNDERSDDGDDNDDSPGELEDAGYTVALEDDPVKDVGEFANLQVELVDPHVEPESPTALEATLTNDTDRELTIASGAPSPFGVLWAEGDDGEESITLWNDAYEETGHVRTDGKRVEEVEDIGLVEELGAGESVIQTFEIHEETPGLAPGTYKTSITVRIESEDPDEIEGLEVDLSLAIEEGIDGPSGTDDDGGENREVALEEPRVDEPPYEIEEPEPPDDLAEDGDWNEDYLGDEMPAEPTLEFEELDGVRLETFALSIEDDDGDQYALDLIESREGLEERFDLDGMESGDRERVEAVDFDEQVVVVFESGFGSGSVHHSWKRVEEREEGIHLYGYYTQPYEQTDDYGSRLSVLGVERPDEGVELTWASLTVSPDRRVHVDSTEGVVAVDPEEG